MTMKFYYYKCQALFPPRRGEVLVEYFVIFVVVAFLTILGLTSFDQDLKTTLTGYFQTARDKLVESPSSSEQDTSTTGRTRPTPIGGDGEIGKRLR